jgi:hypothetical protein
MGVLAAVAAYSWWATGLAPFTTSSYVAVFLPVAGLATAACVLPSPSRSASRSDRPGRPGGSPWYRALPWVALLVVAFALEAAGLALGGRSSAVPTLSTVVDHALAWHAVRFVLFLAWLAFGWAPLVRQAGFERQGT